MPYRLSQEEMDAVSSLPAEVRMAHFIKRVADWEEVWGLRNEAGWVLSSASDGGEAIPFWPHPGYAAACAAGVWADCVPASVELHAFMDQWLPGMASDKRHIAVFPTANSSGALVLPELLLEQLATQCRESYGDDL